MKPTRLFRYTNLPILLDILNKKHLTLVDPSSWDDTNDAYFLGLYKDGRNLKTVLVLCFTRAGETYHIWKVFAGNVNGVCIEFHPDLLLKHFSGMASREVTYVQKKDLGRKTLHNFAQLPFLKRYGFRHEDEFRIVYEDKNKVMSKQDFDIEIKCIKKIIFNPWIPESVFESVKSVINKIDGCDKIPVKKTDLIDTEIWKKMGRKIAGLPDETK